MGNTHRRLQQAEARLLGGSGNPFLSSRYELSLNITIGGTEASPRYTVTDTHTGKQFEPEGEWLTYAEEIRRSGREYPVIVSVGGADA